ncbi:MAG: sigma-70 family RNA polymerase sigma factor, partial [Gemmataceae bacterium]|nr:sigma-70 family RNA polymerase sigma factor [Gemmataceae bacterium]
MPAPVLRLLAAAVAEADADLLGRFVATRDEPAFAELVRRHGPAVYRVCRRLAGPSTADDAFQATFLVLACRAKSVRKAASVGSWLVGVAGRVSRQMRRREMGRASRERERPERSSPVAHAPGSPEIAELAAVLDDELSRLPASLRDPVVLCLIDGRTQEQAAAALGGSVRTVRRRLDRAKAVLRARLERRGVVPAVA